MVVVVEEATSAEAVTGGDKSKSPPRPIWENNRLWPAGHESNVTLGKPRPAGARSAREAKKAPLSPSLGKESPQQFSCLILAHPVVNFRGVMARRLIEHPCPMCDTAALRVTCSVI